MPEPFAEGTMRRARTTLVFAAAVGLAAAAAAQPTSEGHPHKWVAIDKSLADVLADGFDVKAVAYDTSETAPGAEPDVHYFLQKGAQMVRCDFRKRGDASIYWCYQLAKAGP
jgi:hypothetical protein